MTMGLVFMGLGSLGVLGAAILEIKTHESVYAIMMKVFPWVFGMGAVLFGLAMK